MTTVNADWLTKGYFVLRDEGLMRHVRDILERSLRMPKGSLHVRMYPEEQKWKHTVWWREGRAAYKEAQFVAQIARGYPVLSLGLAIEKGCSAKNAGTPAKRMDRSWDWHRLVANAGSVFGSDMRSLARRLQRPVTVRVTVSGDGSRAQAYSFAGGNWYERYEGHGAKWKIVEHLKDVDGMNDRWAIVHLACDLSPADAHGLTAGELASTLIKFNEIRKRLRSGAT